ASDYQYYPGLDGGIGQRRKENTAHGHVVGQLALGLLGQGDGYGIHVGNPGNDCEDIDAFTAKPMLCTLGQYEYQRQEPGHDQCLLKIQRVMHWWCMTYRLFIPAA